MTLYKKDGESWLDALIKLAKRHGREVEVQKAYQMNLACGKGEAEAAWVAAYEWDLLKVTAGRFTIKCVRCGKPFKTSYTEGLIYCSVGCQIAEDPIEPVQEIPNE
jgi:hypothetical protein